MTRIANQIAEICRQRGHKVTTVSEPNDLEDGEISFADQDWVLQVGFDEIGIVVPILNKR